MAAAASVDPGGWRAEFDELMARIAPRFARVEPRRHARDLVLGLMELTALDEHQVRHWTSWHRWTVLAMLAHAFLTVITARQQPAPPQASGLDQPLPALIPLTRNEIRHLFTRLAHHARHTVAFLLHWSIWRRHRQATARACHYRRQASMQ